MSSVYPQRKKPTERPADHGGYLKKILAKYRTMNSDDEVDQVNGALPPAPNPLERKKRKSTKGQERTPAQKESFQKALTILKEKREAKTREEKERFEKATAEEKARLEKEKYEKAKNHKKKLPPAPSYVTMSDLERFKTDLLSAIRPVETMDRDKVEKVEKVEKSKPIAKDPEPPTIKQPIVSMKTQKPLTGHDLIDKLFFS